jgi:Right handed beta helix region
LGGVGYACSESAPCPLSTAVERAGTGDMLSCADGGNSLSATISQNMIIDCAGTAGSVGQITIAGSSVTLRNLTIFDVPNSIELQGGTLILENVHIAYGFGNPIVVQPTSSTTLIVKNCVIDSGGTILLNPSLGGSLTARFDHVTITNSEGGGIRIDTTSGPINVDVTDSEISNNAGNGLNVVGGAGGAAMLSISRSVIAKNGVAGVQVNGATAAAMIDTTLLDGNAGGATSVVAGGHLLTYGTNRIVGSAGSGFTGTAGLQ